MWSRIGVPTEVATMPHSTFLKQRNSRQLPIYMASWTNPAGTGEDILPPTIHSRDTKAGWGIMNQARYSNPKVDELLETALVTMDDAKREKMLQDAGRLALADNVIIPMLSASEMFATRKGVVYKPRNDAITYIHNIVPE